jgi:KDO2-lipid IV(A) lauroyltransferase
LKNGILLAAIRAGLAVADRVPARALLWMGRTAGALGHWLMRGARAIASENLRLHFSPSTARALCRASFVNAGENLAMTLLLRRPRTRALDFVEVDDPSRQAFERALSAGRGVVFVSAHIGPFEAIPAAVEELGIATAVVVRESYDPRLDAFVDQHRLSRGLQVIHRGSPGAPFAIARALRRGKPVGFLPDLGGRVATCATRFLGEDMAWPIGPQVLADRFACAMVVGTLMRVPHPPGRPRFALRIRPLMPAGSLEETTRRVAHRIGQAILERPADWPWMARPIASLRTDHP